MIPTNAPETPGALRARIDYLRNRKVVLDELIRSLERYSAMEAPDRKALHRQRRRAYPGTGLAGAA